MTIEIYHITTSQGRLYFSELPFLSPDEVDEFNKIGHTGKNSKGEKDYFDNFLNGLGKGEFRIDQTKFDHGDFSEKFTIVRVK